MSQQALREAFRVGAFFARQNSLLLYPYSDALDMILAEAKLVYPIKTEERPREVDVAFKGMTGLIATYRFVNGGFEMKGPIEDRWSPSGSALVEDGYITFDVDAFSPESIAALAGLMANPTETVELDG